MGPTGPASARRPLQFSLRGLMLLTLSVAIGLSVAMGPEGTDFSTGLMAMVSLWLVLGLIHQVRDLWSTFHDRTDLGSDVRWGWRFAVLWRLAVACLLVGYFVINFLLTRSILALPEYPDDISMWYLCFPPGVALFYLALVIVLSSVPRNTKERKPSIVSRLFAGAGVLAGACWCLLLFSNQMMLPFLVHVAIGGMDAAEPLSLATEGIDAYGPARSFPFFWISLCATAFLLIHLGVIGQFAHRWTPETRRRWLWAGLLVLSLAVAAAYPLWLVTCGVHWIAPRFSEAYEAGPLHRWVSPLLLVLFAVTAGTCCMVQMPHQEVGSPELNWRRNPERYYHERRLVALLLGLALIVEYIVAAREAMQFGWSILECAGWFLCDASVYLWIAVLLLALRSAFRRRAPAVDSSPAEPPRLPLPRFCAVWCALFLTLIFAVPTIAGASFAVWLGPWYLLSWP